MTSPLTLFQYPGLVPESKRISWKFNVCYSANGNFTKFKFCSLSDFHDSFSGSLYNWKSIIKICWYFNSVNVIIHSQVAKSILWIFSSCWGFTYNFHESIIYYCNSNWESCPHYSMWSYSLLSAAYWPGLVCSSQIRYLIGSTIPGTYPNLQKWYIFLVCAWCLKTRYLHTVALSILQAGEHFLAASGKIDLHLKLWKENIIKTRRKLKIWASYYMNDMLLRLSLQN